MAPPDARANRLVALIAATHPGPTVAVTMLSALLAGSFGHTWRTGALVVAAIFTGQLSIGWSNDLIDQDRDRRSNRADKPVARGDVSPELLRRATAVALLACVGLSLACGWRSGLVHLGLGVASGWAYNLGLKATRWSAAPYAVAFGALPAVVSLAAPERVLPPWWVLATGVVLGIGAHLLNALPDLADDVATGVLGLPQRLGATATRVSAVAALIAGCALVTLAPPGSVGLLRWLLLGIGVALAGTALATRGKLPFLAAVGIAAVCVVGLLTST